MCEVVSCRGERVWISLKYLCFGSDNNQLIHSSLNPILLNMMYDPKSHSKTHTARPGQIIRVNVKTQCGSLTFNLMNNKDCMNFGCV